MALTATTPSNAVATRPVLWKFESDTVNIVRCILEVYADGGGDPIAKIEQNPDRGTSDEFTFDISSVLKDYVSFSLADPDVTDATATTLSQDSSFYGYFVRAYEVLDDGSTGFPSTPDYTSTDFTAYNMAFTHFEWVAPFSLAPFNTAAGPDKKFLTNAPDPKCVYRGELEFVAGLKAFTTGTTFKRDYYNSSDVLQFSETFNIGGSGVTPGTNEMNYGKVKVPVASTGCDVADSQLASPVSIADEYATPADGGNGFMYCLPFIGTDVLKINKSTGVMSTFNGGVVWPVGVPKCFITEVSNVNGKIYGIPFYGDIIYVLDPTTDTVTTLNVPTTTGAFVKWKSCAQTAGGVIYAVPYGGGGTSVDTVLKIDTNTDTVSEFGSILPGDLGVKYGTAGITSGGIIYAFAADSGRQFLKIDTGTDTISLFGAQGNDRVGATRAYEANGFMWGTSFDALGAGTYNIIKINTTNDAVTLVPLGSGAGSHADSALASDGNILVIPQQGDNVRCIDTLTDQITDLPAIETNPRWIRIGISSEGDFYVTAQFSGTANTEFLKLVLGANYNNADYVLVYFEDSGNNPITEKRRYNFKNKCGSGFRVHWQNPYGAQDSYTFEGLYEKGYKHKSKTYQQPLGISFIDQDRGLNVFSSELSEEFTIFSKGVGRAEKEWLSEMLRSKRAWIEIENRFYPIIINDGTFVPENSENTVFQFVISGMLANKSYGQKA